MEKFSLPRLGQEHLTLAHHSTTRRSTTTVVGGSRRRLRQSLITLAKGAALPEHDYPGESTIHVLSGRVRLATASATLDGDQGDLLVIPPERHSLTAMEDTAVLLTVVK